MRQFSVIVIIAALALAPAAAQTAAAFIAELGAAHAVVAGDLHAAAEKMPADKYSFSPAAGVRTFGQVIAHVAGGHFLYCSQGSGLRLDPDTLKRLNDVRPYSNVETAATANPFPKEALLELLEASNAFCRAAYATGTPRDAKALKALVGNVAHSNEHYGNVVTYLRLNGLVPPSTEQAKPAAP